MGRHARTDEIARVAFLVDLPFEDPAIMTDAVL
jgi:hypothetical protein